MANISATVTAGAYGDGGTIPVSFYNLEGWGLAQ